MFLSKSKFFCIRIYEPQMLDRSKCSFVLINFAKGFFFKQGEHSLASKVVPRKRSKSPASIICLFW